MMAESSQIGLSCRTNEPVGRTGRGLAFAPVGACMLAIASLALQNAQAAAQGERVQSAEQAEEMIVTIASSFASRLSERDTKVLADLIRVPTDRLGELDTLFRQYSATVDTLRDRAQEIIAEYGLAPALMGARAGEPGFDGGAEAYTRGVRLIQSEVVRKVYGARASFLESVVSLVDKPDPDRARAFEVVAREMDVRSRGPDFPDPCRILIASRKRDRVYSELLAPEVTQPDELVVQFITQARLEREHGAGPGTVASAIASYFDWVASLPALDAARVFPRWEDLQDGGEGPRAAIRRARAKVEVANQYGEAIAAGIEQELGARHGAESGKQAAFQWRRDWRAGRWPQFFGVSEIERAMTFLGNQKLEEELAGVIQVAGSDAMERLEAADQLVASAYRRLWDPGPPAPPGAPGAAEMDAACAARIRVLDEGLDSFGALLAGSSFEDRWREWVIGVRANRDSAWYVY